MAPGCLLSLSLSHTHTLSLSFTQVQVVQGRSVKQVVDLVLRNQGVQASQWGGVEAVVAECGTRVLKTVSQAPRILPVLRPEPPDHLRCSPLSGETYSSFI